MYSRVQLHNGLARHGWLINIGLFLPLVRGIRLIVHEAAYGPEEYWLESSIARQDRIQQGHQFSWRFAREHMEDGDVHGVNLVRVDGQMRTA